MFLDTVVTEAETFVHHIPRMIACAYGSFRCINLCWVRRRYRALQGSAASTASHRWGVARSLHMHDFSHARTHCTHTQYHATVVQSTGYQAT